MHPHPARLALVGLIALAGTGTAHAGVVDPSFRFGGSGLLDADSGRGPDLVRAILVAPDDSILVAGSFTFADGAASRRIARLLADGTRDAGFSSPFQDESAGPVQSMAVDAAGRIYLGGNLGAPFGRTSPCILRLMPNGSLDPTFGTDGPLPDVPTSIAVDATGRVYAGSTAGGFAGPVPYRLLGSGIMDAPLASAGLVGINGIITRGTSAHAWSASGFMKWNADGSLDPAFHPAPGTPFYAVAPDGAGNWIASLQAKPPFPRGLARFDAAGNPDATFVPDLGPNSPVRRLVALPDGGFVGQGSFTNVGTTPRPGIARFRHDGTFDPAFDPGTGPNNPATALAVQSDGRILAGGPFASWDGLGAPGLVRLLPSARSNPGFVEFASAQLSVAENAGHLVVGLRRISGTNGAASILVSPGSAAPNGIHFAFAATRVAFADGQTNASVDVTIIDDDAINADRAFSLQLGDPSDGLGIGPADVVRVTIQNDDYGVEVGAAAIEAHEVEGRVGIPLHRAGATGDAFDVGLELVPGTAVEGVDYLRPPGPVSFAADATDVTAWIEIPDNRKPDPPRTFTVRLVNPTARAKIAGNASAVVTIRDNDHPGGLASNARFGGPGHYFWPAGRFMQDGGFVAAAFSTYDITVFGPNGNVIGSMPAPQKRLPLDTLESPQSDNFAVYPDSVAWFHNLPLTATVPFGYVPNTPTNPPIAILPRDDHSAYVAANSVSDGFVVRKGVARFHPYGSIDTAFAASIAGGDVVDLAEMPDGKLLVGGTFTSASGTPREGIARLRADGSVDPDYAPRTAGQIPAATSVKSIALLPDGSAYVGGGFATFGGEPRRAIVRLGPAGEIDGGFGTPGGGFTLDAAGHVGAEIRQLALQPDGRILVLGNFGAYDGKSIATMLVRLRPDGSLDETFDIGATPGISRMTLFKDGTVGISGSLNSIDGVAWQGPARLWLGPDEFGTARFARVSTGASGTTGFELDRGISGTFALETSDDLRAWKDSGRRIAMPSGWRFGEDRGDAAKYYRLRRVQ